MINAQYFFSDDQGFFSLQNIPYTKDLVLLQQNMYSSFFNSKILSLVAIFRPPGFGRKHCRLSFWICTLQMF